MPAILLTPYKIYDWNSEIIQSVRIHYDKSTKSCFFVEAYSKNDANKKKVHSRVDLKCILSTMVVSSRHGTMKNKYYELFSPPCTRTPCALYTCVLNGVVPATRYRFAVARWPSSVPLPFYLVRTERTTPSNRRFARCTIGFS